MCGQVENMPATTRCCTNTKKNGKITHTTVFMPQNGECGDASLITVKFVSGEDFEVTARNTCLKHGKENNEQENNELSSVLPTS